MHIQQIGKKYYEIGYKGDYYYGNLLDALNDALMDAFFGKKSELFPGMRQSHIDNIPPGWSDEGEYIG